MNESMVKMIAAALGGVVALVTPIIPLLWVCAAFVLVDALSAYKLNQRVTRKAKLEGVVLGKNSGKFSTAKAYKAITTLRDITILLTLGYLLDTKVFGFFDGLYIANYLAGVFCILQAFSILENASSCNGSSWAKILQKIMVDKTERHLDIDLKDINKTLQDEE